MQDRSPTYYVVALILQGVIYLVRFFFSLPIALLIIIAYEIMQTQCIALTSEVKATLSLH